MSQSVIVKVGANLTANKGLSPIFKDDTYEYIPSLLDNDFNISKHHNHKHYSNLLCQNQNLLGMHMSSFVEEGTGHFDPEFYTFTYGESRQTHIKQLKKLQDNDLVLFCITLQYYKATEDSFVLEGTPELYIIGFFQIEKAAEDILEVHGPVHEISLGRFKSTCNEHVIYMNQHIQTPENKSLLLIKGGTKSAMFKKPLKLTEKNKVLGQFTKNWGIQKTKITDSVVWCSKHKTICNDLQKFGKNNHWTEWLIP